MFPAANNMSNSTNSLSDDANVSCGHAGTQDFGSLNPLLQQDQQQQQQKIKKKRSLPGNPDPDAEVIALSPKTLLATNRFVCEICNKGFQRDQNLQLHRRGHNLPWKLKQRNSKDIVKKRAYVCPEPTCVHHHPSRALGDLTGIKKHFCRKHGEKKWKCEKCSKIYAVQSDWKAHSKTCGTREYRCDCGTLFSRKDSFITHRAFCDALAEESARLSAHHHHHLQLISSSSSSSSTTTTTNTNIINLQNSQSLIHHPLNFPPPPHHQLISLTSTWDPPPQNPNTQNLMKPAETITTGHHFHLPNIGPAISAFQTLPSAATSASPHLSATALLQKAASVGATQATAAAGQHQQRQISSDMMTQQLHDDVVGELASVSRQRVVDSVGGLHQYHVPITTPLQHHQQLGPTSDYQHHLGSTLAAWQKTDRLTRDFLGLTGDHDDHHHENNDGNGVVACVNGNGVNVSVNMREMLTYTGGGIGFQQQYSERDHTLLKPHGFGFAQPSAFGTWE